MAGNINIPANDWLRDRDMVPTPWPPALIKLDLVYWTDEQACEGKTRPSDRALAKTWGLYRSRVRRLLAKWDGKPDPTKAKTAGPQQAHSRPTSDPQQAHSTPSEPRRNDAIDPQQAQTDPQQAHQRPRHNGTRARSSPSPSLSEEERSAWDRLVVIWAEHHPTASRLTPSKGLGADLLARLRSEGEADVATVLRWYDGGSKRAQGLHEGGWGLKTLMRVKNFPDYLEAAGNTSASSTSLAEPAANAWALALRCMIIPGHVDNIQHPDARLNQAFHAAIDAVGWQTLCMSDKWQQKQLEATFKQAFMSTAQEAAHG